MSADKDKNPPPPPPRKPRKGHATKSKKPPPPPKKPRIGLLTRASSLSGMLRRRVPYRLGHV